MLTGKLRVVVIDDESDLREVMQHLLTTMLPDIVDVVAFAPEDVDGIDWEGCQVALVDLMMPHRDGESILAHLMERHPDVYRVAWTAKAEQVRDRMVDDGLAQAVIGKPGFDETVALLQVHRP